MPKKADKPAKKTEAPKKDPVFDVAKPGKAEPDTTSRPIIVTRRPIVEDPMVRQQGDDLIPGPPALSENGSRLRSLRRNKAAIINISPAGELKQGEAAEAPAPSKASKSTETKEKSISLSLPAVKEMIEPDSKPDALVAEPEEGSKKPAESTEETLSQTKKVVTPTEPTLEKSAESKNAKTPNPDKAEKNEDTQDEPGTDEQMPTSQVVETSGLVDELAKQVANKKSKEQEARDGEAKQAKIDKLVAEKTYFLPIGKVTRHKNNRRALVALLLILVLVVAAANFALDAGLFHAPEPIKPLTDIVPN